MENHQGQTIGVSQAQTETASQELQQHGLSSGEPLVLQEIIRSCFANPGRCNYPEFSNKRGLNLVLKSESNHSADHWINLLNTAIIEQFNHAQITLHNLDHIWDKNDHGQPVDKQLYLNTIKTSKWCGPYKQAETERHDFYTIAESGDNEIFICLSLFLDHPPQQVVNLYYCMNKCMIGWKHSFC